jgi:hypothetical protein
MHKWLTALATVFLFAAAATYYLTPEKKAARVEAASPVAVPTSFEGKIITPHPRVPRNMTLDPAQFRDPETKKAYQIAKDKPELLEHMACYCGCMGSVENHTSNLDCFADGHGTGCSLCRRIALDSSEMHDKGMAMDAIKREIDKRYAR